MYLLDSSLPLQGDQKLSMVCPQSVNPPSRTQRAAGSPSTVLVLFLAVSLLFILRKNELKPLGKERTATEELNILSPSQVSPLSKEDAGEYECHASNSQGQASASAKITVVDALHEIPVRKGK